MTSIHEIMKSEGVEDLRLDPLRHLGDNALANVAISLRGFWPDRSDPQWGIVEALSQVPAGVREAALGARYAGDPPSGRHAYGRVTGEDTLRQHCRAAVNVSQTPTLTAAFEMASPLDAPFTLHLDQTRRVNGGPNGQGITPCPEAVHQVRMFDNAGSYIGRVGFNIHREAETPIVTIANIQGVPGKGPIYDQLRRQTGVDPFEATVLFTRQTVEAALPNADFRAMIPPKAKRPDFYKRILGAVGIKAINQVND